MSLSVEIGGLGEFTGTREAIISKLTGLGLSLAQAEAFVPDVSPIITTVKTAVQLMTESELIKWMYAPEQLISPLRTVEEKVIEYVEAGVISFDKYQQIVPDWIDYVQREKILQGFVDRIGEIKDQIADTSGAVSDLAGEAGKIEVLNAQVADLKQKLADAKAGIVDELSGALGGITDNFYDITERVTGATDRISGIDLELQGIADVLAGIPNTIAGIRADYEQALEDMKKAGKMGPLDKLALYGGMAMAGILAIKVLDVMD